MSAQDAHIRWNLEVASHIDTDELVIEIRLDGEDFGIVKTNPSGLELTIYHCSDHDRWTVPAEELLTVIAQAKEKLAGPSKS